MNQKDFLEQLKVGIKDFSGIKLSGLKLNYFSPFKIALIGANIEYSDLPDIALHEANLEKASFMNCYLDRANFQNCNLSHAKFDNCFFGKAYFGNSDMSGVSFHNVDLSETIICEVNLQNSIWKDVTWGGELKMSYVDLTNAVGIPRDKLLCHHADDVTLPNGEVVSEDTW